MRHDHSIFVAAAVLAVALLSPRVRAQASAQTQTPARLRTIDVTGARPVEAAMDVIEQRYGAPVDYSEPIYASTADTELIYFMGGVRLTSPRLVPRTRTISIHYSEVKETPKGIPYLSCKVQSYGCNPVFVWPKNGITALVQKVLKNLAAQGGPVFTVRKISTSYGPRWEVYPVKVRNSLGTFVPQPDFLGAILHISPAPRSSPEMLDLITQQLTKKWGHKFGIGLTRPWQSDVGGVEGTDLGAEGVTARHAIVGLLGPKEDLRVFCGVATPVSCAINVGWLPFREPPRPPTPPAIPARMVPARPWHSSDWFEMARMPKGTLEVQRALAKAGFLNTAPTTKWTASAIDALRRFQAAKGLRPTGTFDIPTARKLLPFLPKIPAHLEPAKPAMDYALAHWLESTPGGRKEIEEGLTKAGFYHGPITGATNSPAAAAALKAFQEANGLPPNGWFTYATAEKLAPYLPKPKE